MSDQEKRIDESWKESVETEKELEQSEPESAVTAEDAQPEMEVNFINYVTSLIFQAMIFLGEMPNPMKDNQVEKNIHQAKFLIDTLIMLRDKTKGNLEKQEEEILNASVYELQTKYVAAVKAESVIS